MRSTLCVRTLASVRTHGGVIASFFWPPFKILVSPLPFLHLSAVIVASLRHFYFVQPIDPKLSCLFHRPYQFCAIPNKTFVSGLSYCDRPFICRLSSAQLPPVYSRLRPPPTSVPGPYHRLPHKHPSAPFSFPFVSVFALFFVRSFPLLPSVLTTWGYTFL